MPMMTEAEALERLGSAENYLNRVTSPVEPTGPSDNVTILPLHPHKGRPALSDAERAAIGVAAVLTSPAQAARDFGVSSTTAMRAAEGKNAAGVMHPAVQSQIQTRLDKVADQAIDRLTAALNNLTDKKIGDEKGTGIAKIASDMANIVEKITPKNREADNVQVIIYAPQQRDISEYEVVDVKAKVLVEGADS